MEIELFFSLTFYFQNSTVTFTIVEAIFERETAFVSILNFSILKYRGLTGGEKYLGNKLFTSFSRKYNK
jgi:hypothetical protein